ncbi:MAG TPA: branched-chain amino acid ABC transporter permease [Thermodesulfobacteriota bacterium]|nr:branched-chain amino acid ABC transporter permease [Thermodesulfobacteriota bacterium]
MSFSIIFEGIIGGLLIGSVYGVIAIGLTIIFGILKIVNFAHGEFLMMGMYLSYYSCLYLGIDPYTSLLIVVPVMFLMGILCEVLLIKPVLNAPQDIQILLTFGVVLVLQNLALLLWTGDWRSLTSPLVFKIVNVGGISLKLTTIIAFLSSILLTLLLFLFLKKTDYGKAIRACSDEPEGALFAGLKLNKVFYLTFGIGTVLAAIPGALILPFFSVSPFVGFSFTLQTFIIIVLGGLGSIPGALIGGFIVGVGESLGALFIPGTLKQIVTFVLFIAIVCLKPSGIFGEKQRE